jgi:pectate lyase
LISSIVCRCHFHQHDKTILIGSDPKHVDDRCMKITIHHCFFNGTRQRHPRVRFAKVHLYNNYTRNWGIYAVCASVESQVIMCSLFEIVFTVNFKTGFDLSPKLSFRYLWIPDILST